MWHQRKISVTDRQMEKVIPMWHFASQAPQIFKTLQTEHVRKPCNQLTGTSCNSHSI